MNQSQRDLRRTAARAFCESLDQLGRNLQKAEPDKSQSTDDAVAIEEALADIEQFMQQQNT